MSQTAHELQLCAARAFPHLPVVSIPKLQAAIHIRWQRYLDDIDRFNLLSSAAAVSSKNNEQRQQQQPFSNTDNTVVADEVLLAKICSMVCSRAIGLGKGITAIVPMFEMINSFAIENIHIIITIVTDNGIGIGMSLVGITISTIY